MHLPKPMITEGFFEDLKKREQKRKELVGALDKVFVEADSSTGIPEGFLESEKK